MCLNVNSITVILEISCGNHNADSCSKCRKGNTGDDWCKGDCELDKPNGTVCSKKKAIIGTAILYIKLLPH